MEKIKKRHLDDSLLEEFDSYAKKGSIEYNDLSDELQLKFITGSGEGGVDSRLANIIQEHTEQLAVLEAGKVSSTELTNYVQKNTPNVITTRMLDAATQRQLAQLSDILVNINSQIQDYLDTNLVSWNELSVDVHNRIEQPNTKINNLTQQLANVITDVEELQAAVELQGDESFLESISDLNTSLAQLQEDVAEIETTASACATDLDYVETSVSAISNDILDLSSSIRDLQEQLGAYPTSSEIDEMIVTSQVTEEKVNELITMGNTFPGTEGQFLVTDGTNNAVATDLFRLGLVANDQDELLECKQYIASGETPYKEILYNNTDIISENDSEILVLIDDTITNQSDVIKMIRYLNPPVLYFEKAGEQVVYSTDEDGNPEHENLEEITQEEFFGDEEDEESESKLEEYAAITDDDEKMFIHCLYPQNSYVYAKKFFYDVRTGKLYYNAEGSSWIVVSEYLPAEEGNHTEVEIESGESDTVNLPKAWAQFNILMQTEDESYASEIVGNYSLNPSGTALTINNTDEDNSHTYCVIY